MELLSVCCFLWNICVQDSVRMIKVLLLLQSSLSRTWNNKVNIYSIYVYAAEQEVTSRHVLHHAACCDSRPLHAVSAAQLLESKHHLVFCRLPDFLFFCLRSSDEVNFKFWSVSLKQRLVLRSERCVGYLQNKHADVIISVIVMQGECRLRPLTFHLSLVIKCSF